MTQSKAKQGWGNPNPHDTRGKFHYFDAIGRSLCGKWGNPARSIELEDANDEHADNCAACKKRVAAHRTKKAIQ